MMYDSEDDDYELPSLAERIKSISKSKNILQTSGSESDESEFVNFSEKIRNTPRAQVNNYAVSALDISSDHENKPEFLKFSEKIHSTPLSHKIIHPSNIKNGSALIDCPEKQKLFSVPNVLKERNCSSFPKASKENHSPPQTKFNLLDVNISSDSEDEAEFLKFSEKIRNTPLSQKFIHPSNMKTGSALIDCQKKQKLFSAPNVLRESSSFSKVSKKNFTTPQTKVTALEVCISSDSENEAEFLKFSERIRNTPRSQNIGSHTKMSQITSDSEDDDVFSKCRFKKIYTPKSQNRIAENNSKYDILNCPEKQKLFPESNALVEKECSGSSSWDKNIGGSHQAAPSASEEFASLFPLQSETLESFQKHRHQYALDLFNFYNRKVFDLKLPKDMPLIWDPLLTRTAGKAFFSMADGMARCYIKLSVQLLTSFDRLRDTLLHEMCHTAVWMVSKITRLNIGHGPLWQLWASRCKLVLPFIECPSRCHNYEVTYSVWYQCPKCNWKRGKCRRSRKYHNSVCKTCKTPIVMTKN